MGEKKIGKNRNWQISRTKAHLNGKCKKVTVLNESYRLREVAAFFKK